MSKQQIITGINVSDQMTKAKEILKKQVIPKENLFQDKKRKGLLNKEHLNVLQANARFDNHRRM